MSQNLHGLYSSNDTSSKSVGIVISIDQIKILNSQPRRYFNPEKMDELVVSIKQYGILEPLIVTSLNNNIGTIFNFQHKGGIELNNLDGNGNPVSNFI